MKRKMVIVLACCMALGLAACGAESESAGGLQIETVEQQDVKQDTGTEEVKEEPQSTETVKTKTTITEEQALNAIRNYCFEQQPELKDMVDSDEYALYWEASTSDAGEIVVLYRSYTGALIRYYVDPETGDAYVTEQVPGIIDDEQKNGETLNIREYMD